MAGNHTYSRFNLAGGLTYKILPELTVYASFADANRAPTPAELICSSAASPCSLANFFYWRPEPAAGRAPHFQGGSAQPAPPLRRCDTVPRRLRSRGTLNNDILFVKSAIQGRAFFQNIGTTLRQGVDLNPQLKTDRLLAWFAYFCTDFQTGFTASSTNNPEADADGNIQVRPGNHIPDRPGARRH